MAKVKTAHCWAFGEGLKRKDSWDNWSPWARSPTEIVNMLECGTLYMGAAPYLIGTSASLLES